MPYNPNLRAAAYSTVFLEARSRALLFKQVNGTQHQKRSPGIAGELATINTELAKRFSAAPAKPASRKIAFKRLPGEPAAAPVPRNLNRNRLDVAPAEDVARAPWQPYTQPAGLRLATGYSGAVRSVTADFSPKLHSQYR